jgi:hypothetical protein
MVTELPSKFSALLAQEKRRFDRSLGEDLREIRANYGNGSHTVLLLQQRYETDIEKRLSTLLATLSRLLASAPAREIRDHKPELDRLAQIWFQSHIEDCQSRLNELAARIGSVSADQLDLGRDRFLNALAAELDLLSIPAPSMVAGREAFVDPARIEELASVQPAKFDVSRLVRLCEELNLCFSHHCFHAVAFITRAILDHIPPVFGFKTFKEVANNYSGGKSVRAIASQLEDVSRKVSDVLLHMPMSDSEILPTLQQVDVRQQLDTVLGEVIRIGRRPA